MRHVVRECFESVEAHLWDLGVDLVGNRREQLLYDVIVVKVEELCILSELVHDVESSFSELLELIRLALIRLFNHVRKHLNEWAFDQLLLKGGRL